MDSSQLKKYIIEPTLKEYGLFSPSAVNLLLGTAAQESKLGYYINQLDGGPALGIYQMEPRTHDDIWINYYRAMKFTNEMSIPSRMRYDLKYATLMARLHYLRVPKILPDPDDIVGLAEYWKEYYNTHLGAGTISEFIDNYKRYVNE